MIHLRRLSMLLAFALPIGLAPGCAPNESTKGQLIECDVGPGGAVTNCHPTEQSTPEPGKCIDVDEDGDDDPHDDADEADDDDALRLTGRPGGGDDDDGDGTPDEMDDDDDNDGVDDADDCDEQPGGDDDDSDDI